MRRAAQIVLHAALVLALCGSPTAALLFSVISCILVLLKNVIPQRFRRAYAVGAAISLAGATLAFRGSFTDLGLTFLGVSYAFLRVVRALLVEEVWTLGSFLRYFFFFPTFFSGPVLEPSHLAESGKIDVAAGLMRVLRGVLRIGAAQLLLGFIPLGNARQELFAITDWSQAALWLGTFLSGVWLYLNFSGYSEIYIGLARWCGVRAPENFDHPYGATDITAFWQRWHITLGDWLRATIYTPLARALVGVSPVAAAVVVPIATMMVCGAWHELTPNFLLWGGLHGLALGVHALWRRLPLPRQHRAYRAAAWLTTHAFVAMTWPLFLPLDATMRMRWQVLGLMFGV